MKTLHFTFFLLFSALVAFTAGQNETQITISNPVTSGSSNAGNRTITIILSQTQSGESSATGTPQVTVSNPVVSSASKADNVSVTATTATTTPTTAPNATATTTTTATATTATTATNATATTTTSTVVAPSKIVVSISSRALPPAGATQNQGPQAQGAATGVVFPAIVDSPLPEVQSPNVWMALNFLKTKGRSLLSDEVSEILASSVAGRDYPNYSSIPETSFRCDQVKQAGFYADPDAACQVFRRCDINGYLWSFLCPNQTLFNQVTLVCDWFYNVDCSRSASLYDYSNSRLYHSNWRLLDDK